MSEAKGVLYLCPTPIGNLEDITLRALKVLKEADYIAAEDTRVTIKLLNHYEIKGNLISYHEHNKRQKGPELISLLSEGKTIALVTDAGTPGISDPGEDLVKEAIDAGIRVIPLPGAVAAICALIASGLSAERFVFEGFLPRKTKERKERLSELSQEKRTMILYEAPHRIKDTLKDIKKALGNRQMVVAREITKMYEEFFRGSVDQVIDWFSKKPPRGEMVLVIDGLKAPDNQQERVALNVEELLENPNMESNADFVEFTKQLNLSYEKNLKKGMPKNRAMRKAALEFGITRNQAYDILMRK